MGNGVAGVDDSYRDQAVYEPCRLVEVRGVLLKNSVYKDPTDLPEMFHDLPDETRALGRLAGGGGGGSILKLPLIFLMCLGHVQL
mmetsp:Transcript_87246/g.182603  ORF Transcript_87246/g.182603 Transcript_87246/m.182603 type:complete len:85 (-) Transcript_87246:188-442(-)